MKVTQGVFKNTNVYGITFVDKYSNIKSISSTDNYTSNNNISQTSTILTDDHSYYNVVENSSVVNCNIENGRFFNSKLLGVSGQNNYINNGYFSGCTLSNYIINGGSFINCVVDTTNKWNNGYWDNQNGHIDFSTTWINGVWNSGLFNNPHGWSGGTFNGGTFAPPAVWYDGVANGGTFSGITWHNGLVRNADFIERCVFEDGTFNGGNFIDGHIHGGTFNNVKMINSNISGGTFNDGTVSGCTIYGSGSEGGTVINGGIFTNDTINNALFNNSESDNLIVNSGIFLNGNYTNSIFNTGEIHNGVYTNITGSTSGLLIYNGIFRNSTFSATTINNGNFTNCYSDSVNWKYGVYTDGEMYDSLWYDGYWNDGTFSSKSDNTSTSGISFSVGLTGTTTTTTTTIYAPTNISIISVYSGGTNIYVSFSGLTSGSTSTIVQYAQNGFFTSGLTSVTGGTISPINLGFASTLPTGVLYFRMYTLLTGSTYSNVVSYTNNLAPTTTTTTTTPIVSLSNNSVTKTLSFNITGVVVPYSYQFHSTNDGSGCASITISPNSGISYTNNGASSYVAVTDYLGSSYDIYVTVLSISNPSNHITIHNPCLVPTTLITMSDDSVKMIKDVNIGDSLLTLVNSEYVKTLVINKSSHIVDKIININDGLLESSEYHIHLIKENELIIKKIAIELKEGDILIDKNGNDVIINSLVIEYGDTDVINISTDLETYIANNIITHNKTACNL